MDLIKIKEITNTVKLDQKIQMVTIRSEIFQINKSINIIKM